MNLKKLMGVIALVLPALLLGACGGGGSSSSETPKATTELNWDQGNWDQKNWQ